jgi:hypothetical protein
MFLYLAADRPLRQIAWDAQQPAFWVGEAGADADAVRHVLAQPHIYAVGSHEQCGCGFDYGQLPLEDDQDRAEDAACRQSLRRLREYLAETVARVPVQLYASWSDDLLKDPLKRLEVGPSYFDGEEFALENRTLFLVTKESHSLQQVAP